MVKTLEELNLIREECRAMVTKRAAASGVVSIVPIPGTDIAADIGMLMELLPAISKRFGLSQEDIEKLDEKTKIFVLQAIKITGSQLIGQAITKELIAKVLTKIAGRVATKQVLKYVPFAGQVASAVIGFTTMKYIGNTHVEECYAIVKNLIERQPLASQDEAAATKNAGSDNEYAGISRQEVIDILKQLKELLDAGIIETEEFEQKKKQLMARL
jgi:uncharacterized protein (DUF697 family)